MEKPIENYQSQPSSSRSSSRRTSSTIARDSLPTPPPDPRTSTTTGENIFKYPPEKKDLPTAFHTLLDYTQQADEFYKNLHRAISQDCKRLQTEEGHNAASSAADTANAYAADDEAHKCASCQTLRGECEQLIDPLQNRLGLTIGAALAAYGAVDQLNRLYALWDQYCDLEKKLRRQKECLRYVNLLDEKMLKARIPKEANPNVPDAEAELQNSITLLNTILANENTETLKRSSLKQQRERSKSVMVEDASTVGQERDYLIGSYTVPYILRRQSTYSEGKSKVSKWTKVKAAFKWERANVPATCDLNRDVPNVIGLTPVNHEVARYLRVPAAPCGGGSSADSILSSSSGHLLSETGTPGTISSASSMDDLDGNCRNTLRRDSTKSDNHSDSRIFDDVDQSAARDKAEAIAAATESQKLPRNDSNKSPAAITFKSSSNKSLRKCKVVSEFETLPEDVIANIKSTPTRKSKPPLSPLNLNLKQDLNDLEFFYSPHSLKSPKEGTQSLQRSKKINSPGNSSVPSSPSRHSDFFAEFESEELSSGDFSEPTSPSHLSTRITFQQKQDEINQRYQILRAKLDKEFEAKRHEWEKMKSTTNACRALALISPAKSEEHSPNQAYNANLSAKMLEENLTPDFKKKLRKWRVKKQISLSGSQLQPHILPTSPHKDSGADTKVKIDWNLWKTGQLKLEGQGLSPLPDQKDLPEEFQKKLEQWNKIKRGGSVAHGHYSLKRSSKHGADASKKGSDDDRAGVDKDKRSDKHKPHEKDKLEKLAKLKAIVTDHPAKEIEVKTSEGVMKFEGISRKFTRKLYEWEKARGIGPESSTFALLHPGYCPIDVGRISKDNHNNENSPTLSRSLSLDSIAPNSMLPAISQQASSLSLNDVNELKELDGVSSCDALADGEFKKYDEPEAVMVEVEDHIVETASPLVTSHTLVEHQTPVYKYEEVACNDFCNSRRVQSFESYTNLAPLISALKRTDELFVELKKISPDIAANAEIRHCEDILSFIRSIYPYYTENLVKVNVLDAISDVQCELSRVSEMNEKLLLDEACCREIMEERTREYNEELKGLHESLELLKQRIHGGVNRYPMDIVPDINITCEDCNDWLPYAACAGTDSRDPLTTTFEATNEVNDILVDSCNELPGDIQLINTISNSNAANGNCPIIATTGSTAKKKRLRKMGSRQNSKTESDSSDDDTQSLLETPRRVKRKNYRLKQRSLDEDYKRIENSAAWDNKADVVYVLKVKPGHAIQHLDNVDIVEEKSAVRMLGARTESCVELGLLEKEAPAAKETPVNANANVFVKTKRKVFTTIEEPNSIDGVSVIAHDVEQLLDVHKINEGNVHLKKQQVELAAYGTIAESYTRHEDAALQVKPFAKGQSHLSLSLDDVRELEYVDERRCHSDGSIRLRAPRKIKGVRSPLASDSFRVINKSYVTLNRELRNASKEAATVQESTSSGGASVIEKRKEHRFRKNRDKIYNPSAIKLVSATIKKIETKIAKTNSGSSVEQATFLAPDRLDNTLPRISRKLERKSLTPTTQQMHFEYPLPASSEPTTPLFEIDVPPRTPLTERAQRLQKAKEEFLQNTAHSALPSCRRRDEIVRTENWEKHRCSDNSLSSITTGDDVSLLKSLSADTITAEAPTQSDAGTDLDVSAYDSLPRAVSRSAKLSSKLGFATLASKFRRVKAPKKPREASASSSALSELCRQSLMVDAISAPQIAASAERSHESVMKSQSSPHAVSGGAGISRVQREVERLNKSQSEQYVKRQKESFV